MNALSRIVPQRTRTFEAWRTSDETPRNEAHPLTISADTLIGAVDQASHSCHHKDTLLVLETDTASRKRVLHSYRIVKKAAKWVRNPVTGISERVAPLEASLSFSLAVDTFVPVEPFRWAPLVDVVGADLTMVEGRVS